MFSVGDKIVYGENGVCTVEAIAPLPAANSDPQKLYYHLAPFIGSGMYYTPTDSGAFMRAVISSEEAEALIDSIPEILPAICEDNRFNHVDAYYKALFKQHSNEVLVAVIKGLELRMNERKTKSTRVENTMRRAKELLNGELATALGIDFSKVDDYIAERTGCCL